MFSYSRVKNYQLQSFATTLNEVVTNFSNHSISGSELLEKNSSGWFLFSDYEILESTKKEKFHNIIIENIMLLGEAIDNGHYIVINKDFSVLDDPKIIFRDKSVEPIINPQQLKIDFDNFHDYKIKLEKFLVCALNFDPFIYIDSSSYLKNSFNEDFFKNNLKILEYIGFADIQLFEETEINNQHTLVSFLPKFIKKLHDISKIEKLINTELKFNFNNYFSSYNSTLNNNSKNYNTSDYLRLLPTNIYPVPEYMPYDIVYYSNDYHEESSPLDIHNFHIENHVFSYHLSKLESFAKKYSSEYLSRHFNLFNDILLQKLFSISFKNSNFFYEKNITNVNNICFHNISSLYAFIEQNHPHLKENFQEFILNITPTLSDKIKALSFNERYHILNSKTKEVIEQQIILELQSSQQSLGNTLFSADIQPPEFKILQQVILNNPNNYQYSFEEIQDFRILIVPNIFFLLHTNNYLVTYPLHYLKESQYMNSDYGLSISPDYKNLYFKLPKIISKEDHISLFDNITSILQSFPENVSENQINEQNENIFHLINKFIRESVLTAKTNQIPENESRLRLKI